MQSEAGVLTPQSETTNARREPRGALLPYSIWGLIIGVVTIDYGLQAVHVANQSLIYRVRPEARSRLTAGYMISYSIGCATGSIVSTLVYAKAGWTGVSALGAAISALP